MKAIRTRYVGPTNTRGSRIIASDADGNKVGIGYPHDLDSEGAHAKAAYALMDKMKWPNKLVSGGFGRDMFWVMLPIGRETKAHAFQRHTSAHLPMVQQTCTACNKPANDPIHDWAAE